MLLETLFVGLVWSTWRNIIDDKGIVEGAFEIPTAELYQTRYALPPEQVFSFNLSCTAIDFRQCDAMDAILNRAGLKIASSLVFKKQINIKARVFEFDSDVEVFSRAIPRYQYAARMYEGQLLMFPNSVLKQRANTTSDVEVYFEEYDIELEFNSRAHWYFGKEGEAVPQNMLDFEYVAVHEITHGLGLKTTLVNYRYAYNRNTDYFAPPLFEGGTGTQKSIYFYPMSAFDSLIRGSASFRELGSMISQSERSSVSQVARFLATFEKFKPGYYAAQDLYKMISTQRLYIHPTFGNHVYLSGGPSIERQDPIFTHYSAESASTPDFLMTCAIRAGVSLNLTMAKYSMTSVYGADTLKILEGIGYATPLFPVFPKFQIDFSFGTYTYNPAESRSVENLLF